MTRADIIEAMARARCVFEKRPPDATGDFFDSGTTRDEPAWKFFVPAAEAELDAIGKIAVVLQRPPAVLQPFIDWAFSTRSLASYITAADLSQPEEGR